MKKQAQHNFIFCLNKKPDKPSDIVHIYINYGHGYIRRKVGTNIKIEARYWDNSKKEVKSSCNTAEIENLQLSDYKKRALECIPNLRSGEKTWSSAFDYILDKQKQNDDTLLNWLQTSPKATQIIKFTAYINAIEKMLSDNGLQKFVPLKFSILNDSTALQKIAKCILDSGLKSTTLNNYMKCVDIICNKAQNIIRKPFANDFTIPSVNSESLEGRKQKDIYDSLNKIKTLQDFEALILWLFQFSLRGLNMVDIANISEDRLANKKKQHFYPDFNAIKNAKNFKDKNYFITKRKKTKDKVSGSLHVLINLFPTLTLHKVLKRLISISHSDYAYKGQDNFRLFNFTTLDHKNKVDKEGMDSLKAYRDTMSTKLRRLIGAGVNNTRHTFTQTAEKISNVKELDLNKILGQTKNVVKHYTSKGQLGVDLIHIQTLEDYGFLKIVDIVLQFGAKNFEQIDNKEIYYVEPFNFKTRKDGVIIFDEAVDNIEQKLFELNTYNSWSYEEELRYQNLVYDYKNKQDPYLDEDGKLKYKERKISKELEEMIERKQKIHSN